MTQPSASSPDQQPQYGQSAPGQQPPAQPAQPGQPAQPWQGQATPQQALQGQPHGQPQGQPQPGYGSPQQYGAAPGYNAQGAPGQQFQQAKEPSGLLSTDFSKTTTGPTAKLAYTMILVLAAIVAFAGLINGIGHFTYMPYSGFDAVLRVVDGLIVIAKGAVVAVVLVTVGRLLIEHFVQAAKKN